MTERPSDDNSSCATAPQQSIKHPPPLKISTSPVLAAEQTSEIYKMMKIVSINKLNWIFLVNSGIKEMSKTK